MNKQITCKEPSRGAHSPSWALVLERSDAGDGNRGPKSNRRDRQRNCPW